MSKRGAIWIAALVAPVLLIAAAAWLLLPPRTRTGVIVIDLSSPDGSKFEGSCAVDGVNRNLSGDLPARFTFEGNNIVYSFTPMGETNEISVKVNVDPLPVDVPASVEFGRQKTAKGVRGWVRFERSAPSYWIESFDPKAPGQWRMAPPSGNPAERAVAPDRPRE
jgi:hypothetical protein